MPLRSIPIDDITEEDLLALIEAAVPERQEVDYKRDMYGRADGDKREFLADVSSFANTAGGHLIIGMAEESGAPVELPGIDGNVDAEKQRLESLAHDGLEPPILGLRMASVPLANGGHAIVIRIPRSWNPPHRVVAHGSNRFYARNSGGKYEPKVEQLRQLFLVEPSLAERIRDFRFDRLAKIAAGETPVRLVDRSCVVLHVVPFESMDGTPRYAIKDLYDHWTEFDLIRSRPEGLDRKINLDGLVTHGGTQEGSGYFNYTQVWRSGAIESVRAGIVVLARNGERGVSSGTQERNLINTLTSHLTVAKKIGLPFPLVVMVSLIGVAGARLGAGQGRHEEVGRNEFDRDMVHASQCVMETFSNEHGDVARTLRPAFDEIHNAADRLRCPHFDEDGDWVDPDYGRRP